MKKSGESFWADRPVFVTGATGFVGSNLVNELLRLKAKVSVLIRDNDPQSWLYKSGGIDKVHVVSGAVEDFWSFERALSEYEIDTVFHLAAQPLVGAAHRFPMQTFESNIRGTYNLLEACRIHSSLVKRVVVASSDKAYGEHDQLPYTEDMRLVGKHPYEVSKSCADLVTQSYFHTYKLPVAIARCGNIFGSGDLNWSRIVPGTIRSLLNGQSPILRSDGTFIRDYIYVKDVASAYITLAESLENDGVVGEAFNFGPERPLSVLELVNIIRKAMHCEKIEPTILNNAKGEIRDQYLCSTKAHEVLSWKPKHTLEQGLAETIEWYRSYLNPQSAAKNWEKATV